MRDYTSFINDNVEEEPPFDPWEWQKQMPRVLQEPGFYGSNGTRSERFRPLKDLDIGLPLEEIIAALLPTKDLQPGRTNPLDWIQGLGGRK